MDKFLNTVLICKIIQISLASWVTLYKGIHELKTIYCLNIYCEYGFLNQFGNGTAEFLNCTSSPLTGVYLDGTQLTTTQSLTTLTPTAPHAYKIIVFDIYYTNEWFNDVIQFDYQNLFIIDIRYTTNNPLNFDVGLCGTQLYDIKTYYFYLPYTSIALTYPKFTITNSSVKAQIRNVFVSYQSCYTNCLSCTGPSIADCSAWTPTRSRCSIRQSDDSINCVNTCPISNGNIRSLNRICVKFVNNNIFQSDLSYLNLVTLASWNIIYDYNNLDISNKKTSPYYLGLFKYNEGAYVSLKTSYDLYPLATNIQLVFCNLTPQNSGVSFYIDDMYYGSIYYDGTTYILDNLQLKSQSTYSNVGTCTNNQYLSLDMFHYINLQTFVFSIKGNFTQPGTGWFLRQAYFTSGYCPLYCLTCNSYYKCKTCLSDYYLVSDGSCQKNCPSLTIIDYTNKLCTYYNKVTNYSQYLVKELEDFTVTDSLNQTFKLESSTVLDLMKGSDIFWSYETTKIVFGGKYVWAQARFSQIYNLQPHHSLTIYFQVIFGSNFPNLTSNYLQYEINNSTPKYIYNDKTSTQSIIEQVSVSQSTLSIALQCFGLNSLDSYCAISNYYIVVHYCRPFCLQCTNEFDCSVWSAYNNSIKAQNSDCLSNQFIDESTHTCENCPDECLTCFNEYECYTCQPNYYLYKTTCLLACLINQYYDGSSCLDCKYSCKQCKSFDYCIHCESSNLRFLENGQCKCYDGYYDQPNTAQCQPCNKLCQICNGPADSNCLSCISLNNLIQNGQTCQCQDGYYFDSQFIQCKKCQSQCETCFGASNQNCLSCYISQFRNLEGFQCKCQEGYYTDNLSDICLQCPSTIDNLLSQCFKTCGDDSSLWFNQPCPSVVCINSYYQNINNKCIPICGDGHVEIGYEECDDVNNIQFDGCYNCRNQCPIQCTNCLSTGNFICNDICGDGYATGLEECDDGNNIQYDGCYQCKLECQVQCTKCIRGVCFDCQEFGWSLNSLTFRCIETCGDSYMVGTEDCEEKFNLNSLMNDGCYNCQMQCQPSCHTCSLNGCLVCEVGYQLIHSQCQNICGDKIQVEEEQCDDGNLYPFDGCHTCKYQCQPSCLNCYLGECLNCDSNYILESGQCTEIINKIILEKIIDKYVKYIEFCKNQIEDICFECQKGFLLNKILNKCEIYIYTMTKIQQYPYFQDSNTFIEYCQLSFNGICIKCHNLYLFNYQTQLCEPICGDGKISGREQCEDGNYIQFDGCYNCQYQCSAYCIDCWNGYCYKCEEDKILVPSNNNCEIQQICFEDGTYYNEYLNECDSKCGDGIKVMLEKCDDGNEIPYDGCYKCEFSCHPDCTYCFDGQCIKECEIGSYFNQKTNDCLPQCGDGIVYKSFEQCDDSNDIQDDGCNNCKIECQGSCEICENQQICQKCKQGYDLIDNQCQVNYNCLVENCIICESYFCYLCEDGYYFENSQCISKCGDGIVVQNEACDDGNDINNDGCNNDCLPSSNSQCRNSECVIVIPPVVKLDFNYEKFGIQYLTLLFDQPMKLQIGTSKQDFINSLQFEIFNYSDIALFSLTSKNEFQQNLELIEIEVSVQFQAYVERPKLKLTFLDTNLLVNKENISIEQKFIFSQLLSPNFLNKNQQQAVKSLIAINEYMLNIIAAIIIIASITGQFEIISNLLDLIQQLYYLKYINTRIGVNLAQFYELFRIIQLTNLYDSLQLNPEDNFSKLTSFYKSEPVFEYDKRNANCVVNLINIMLAYLFVVISYIIMQYLSKLLSSRIKRITFYKQTSTQLFVIKFFQSKSFSIQQLELFPQILGVFFSMIYEFGTSLFLALKYSPKDLEGRFSFFLALFAYLGTTLFLINNIKNNIPLNQNEKNLFKTKNVYTYVCLQKLFFMFFLIFFFYSPVIQILLNLLNEFQYSFFITIFKIIPNESEKFKQITSHSIQFIIYLLYLTNVFVEDQPNKLIIIGWVIISLMSLIIISTVITDLLDIVHPIIKKCQTYKTNNENINKAQDIFCIIEHPVTISN